MITRQSVKMEYEVWRKGGTHPEEEDEYVDQEEADKMPPSEQVRFYKSLRNRVLRFTLMLRIAVDSGYASEDNQMAMADLRYAMVGLRSWYYARPKLH
jgi:hypothetical protein